MLIDVSQSQRWHPLMSCSVHNQSFNVGGAKKLENIHIQVSSTCGTSGRDTAVQHDGLWKKTRSLCKWLILKGNLNSLRWLYANEKIIRNITFNSISAHKSCTLDLQGGEQQQRWCTARERCGRFVQELPVWVRGGKHELELYYTCVVPQLSMLNAVQLICDVSSADVHLT